MPWLWVVVLGAVSACDQPRTRVAQGYIEGLTLRSLSGRPYSAFLGLPFAAPPTGPLRFKEPMEPEGWEGVLNATRYKPECIYHSSSVSEGQEDCLYLNVFTPKLVCGERHRGRLLDVLVNFPPGGYVKTPPANQSRPTYLMDKDIVVVTAYYRLGALGFLSTGDESARGNAGLKDMVAVLRWIKTNIEAFGGDPSSVTASGSSAGAQAVHLMLVSPLAKGLMKRAISAGGSGISPRSTCPGVEERSRVLAQHFGCLKDSTNETVHCLQQIEASSFIVPAADLFYGWLGHPVTVFCPVVESAHEGAFLTSSPWSAVTQTPASDVPWLITTNALEGLSSVVSEVLNSPEHVRELDTGWDWILPHLLEFNGRVSEARLPSVTAAIRNFYLGERNTSQGLDAIVQMLGDRLVSKYLVQSALVSSQVMKSPIYVYYFGFLGSTSSSNNFKNNPLIYSGSAAHIDDVTSFVFQKTSHNLTPEERSMVRVMVDIWYRFITTGKPFSSIGRYRGWKSIQESYPELGFLNISSPLDIKLDTSSSLGNTAFWDSLAVDPAITPSTVS